ncbi:MAG: acyltransferase domain-containing protein, partial [bacterium]|nr:acyltransferase domain-containing protein [bacterium]
NTATRIKQQKELTETERAQPAIGAMSLSLLSILETVNITADFLCGHSYGELTALYAAGVISSKKDLLELSSIRGELMKNKTGGTMTAVFAPDHAVKEILNSLDSTIVIANINGPKQTVLSGAEGEMAKIETTLKDNNIFYKRIPVSAAFHSSDFHNTVEDFYTALENFDLSEPQRKIWLTSLWCGNKTTFST